MVATGTFPMQSVERRSYAAQFWRAWPGLTTLRKVARALFEHGVLGQEWPGVRSCRRLPHLGHEVQPACHGGGPAVGARTR